MQCHIFRVSRKFPSRIDTRRLSAITLRPYQERCIDACIEALALGPTRLGVSLPTGSGKTTVFISLLSRIPPHDSLATRSLIIVNSIELARQSAQQVKQLYPKWSVEIEQGAKHQATGQADVTIATYQTLLQPNRLAKFDPRTLKAIIVDEAHHAAAPSYRRLLSCFDTNIKHPDSKVDVPTLSRNVPIIGFSATFSRHDGLALGSVFEQVVYHRDFVEMIKEEWLCDVRFTSVRTNMSLKQVAISPTTGDFAPISLGRVINNNTFNNLIVQAWLDRAVSRKSTLIFCVNISHVLAVTQVFRSYGIDARYICSTTPAAERKNLIDSFRTGVFPVLINCAILTEGADIPNIDCIIVARPTRSRNVFAQMIGRGMRLSPNTGKENCRIIDFVDSTERVDGVISTPTLFGLDPEEIEIDDETTESLEKLAVKQTNGDGTNITLEPTTITYSDHEDPFSLTARSSGAPHIITMSRNAWVGCGSDIYVLECLGKGHVRIEPVTLDAQICFDAFYTPAMVDKVTASSLKISPYMRSRKILRATTLGDAVRGCDTYVKAKVLHGMLGLGILRSAAWRKLPASDQQKQLIAKRWSKRNLDNPSERAAIIAQLKKGDAANIITRLKHGAQARYEKKLKASARIANNILKEQHRRAREVVQVGPLTK
ncbi:P-loop containing nucleoside triphosphate hydrolase protein [Infundibulicybe gibba]|nr:P-loop containing nucleoside triphosphate hydrolase protein [Infundibulicybe gibba]